MDLEFYWDEAGDPRAGAKEDGAARLAAFLESDIQGSDVYAREVLEALERVAAGDLDGWETTGNAHTLGITRDGAILHAEYEDEEEPVHLALEDVRDALANWITFLEEKA